MTGPLSNNLSLESVPAALFGKCVSKLKRELHLLGPRKFTARRALRLRLLQRPLYRLPTAQVHPVYKSPVARVLRRPDNERQQTNPFSERQVARGSAKRRGEFQSVFHSSDSLLL